MKVALYARVSTHDQECLNQLLELRRVAEVRGWTIVHEYVDQGISGAKESRPALDAMMGDARRRRFDLLCVWSLDRLGRSLKGLIAVLDDLHALSITFVSLREGLDLSTPSGRLQWQIIGAISEFERNRISERVRLGLARVKAQGTRLGRPRLHIPQEDLRAVEGLSLNESARSLGVSRSTLKRWRRGVQKTPSLLG